MQGLLVIDKPEGLTSFDVVARIRGRLKRLTGDRHLKVGHTGTLDPFATGVLPICVGAATRLAQYLIEGDKTYRATLRLGAATDTEDRTGQITATADWQHLDDAAVRAAIEALPGDSMQIPPRFSAIHVDGRRAYDLARAGADFELEPRPITIHEARVRAIALPDVEFDLRCSKGTYIRSICRDLGAQLGVHGHCAALRRLEAVGLHEDQATPLDDLLAAEPERLAALLLDPLVMLSHMPRLDMNESSVIALRHGQRVLPPGDDAPPPGALACAVHQGHLVAVVLVEPDGRLKPERVIPVG